MTREEVKKAAETMLAFADGTEIQYSHKGQNNWLNWINESSPSFDWQTFDYRIKPEPKYRPFKTAEECWNEMYKHPNFGWLRTVKSNNLLHVLRISGKGVGILGYINTCTFEVMFQQFEFTDGTPFGIKEE